MRFDIEIVFGVKTSYTKLDGLFDRGSIKLKEPSFHSLGVMTKFEITVVALFTVKTALICADVYPDDAACVAVIVVWPLFRIITVRVPDISATVGLLLINANEASGLVLLEEGSINRNETSPYVRGEIEKLDKVGVIVDIRMIAMNIIMKPIYIIIIL